MKRFFYITLAVALSLPACRHAVVPPPPYKCPCRIEKITQKASVVAERTGAFTYNAFGDPVAFIPLGYSTTGSVRYEFKYDANRRLTDYIGYYPVPSATPVCEFWTKYYYNAKGQVVRDTSYASPAYGAQLHGNVVFKSYTHYEYDGEGRISRTVFRQLVNGAPNGLVRDYKFVYNGQGNLVLPGAVYDDKVSVYRSNNVWMFLNRNYSRNNVRRASGYNIHGLPLGFSTPPAPQPSLGMLQFIGLNNVSIDYRCD